MKRYYFLIVLLLTSWVSRAQILPKPANATLVTDNAHVLSPEQAQTLESRLVALDDSTTNQIAIVTIPTLNGYDIADYANKLLRDWGIGSKKKNNGVLILVAVHGTIEILAGNVNPVFSSFYLYLKILKCLGCF